jgi:hypothetical protein
VHGNDVAYLIVHVDELEAGREPVVSIAVPVQYLCGLRRVRDATQHAADSNDNGLRAYDLKQELDRVQEDEDEEQPPDGERLEC